MNGQLQDPSLLKQIEEMSQELENERELRTLAERALSAKQNDLDYLFVRNPLPMWIYEVEDKCFVEVNGAAVQQYGYTRKEFLSMRVTDMIPVKLVQRIEGGGGSPKTSYQHSSSWHLPHKDGSALEVDIVAHEIVFDERQCCVVIALDVTERNATEARLHRTEKLEAIGRLSGGVAHDFNNQLTVIRGSLEGMQELVGDVPAAAACIRDGLDSVARGAKLTNRLLAYARQQVLDPKAVDVRQLVADMTELLDRALGASVELKVILSPELWQTQIDPGRLEDALLNLAVNAKDAMPQGGTLTIDACNFSGRAPGVGDNAESTPGEYVLVTVADTGDGMSAAVLERALEPFFTTKEVANGNGLGLSMVEGFVRQSGGHMALTSQPGSGTVVRLFLPRTHDRVESAMPSRFAETPAVCGKGEVILLVEDDGGIRRIARRILETLGYEVFEAEDGLSALLLLAESPPIDLLFTDFTLPNGMSGFELAEEVRGKFPQVRVLYMSGYLSDISSSLRLCRNTIHLLAKPFGADELARTVRLALDSPVTLQQTVLGAPTDTKLPITPEVAMNLGFPPD